MGEAIDSHHHLFYPNDCVLLTFDPIQSMEDLNPEQYFPFPTNDTVCEFEFGGITCERMSGNKILLKVNEIAAEIDGTIS